MKLSRILIILLVCLAGPLALAQITDNECDPGESPDVIVGDIFDVNRYGSVGGITGYSFGTESCNKGTCEALWIGGTPEHPVIGMNMFRLKDGRFEQIGQSWLKHGFFDAVRRRPLLRASAYRPAED